MSNDDGSNDGWMLDDHDLHDYKRWCVKLDRSQSGEIVMDTINLLAFVCEGGWSKANLEIFF